MLSLRGLSPLRVIRARLGAALVVGVISGICCLGGALMTFVLAPAHEIQANRISAIPLMDARALEATSPGEDVLITGLLEGNASVPDVPEFAAYRAEEWVVTQPLDTEGGSEPRGNWKTIRIVIPVLNLSLDGRPVMIHVAEDARLGGALHELVIPGGSTLTAQYQGETFSHGTVRYYGLINGDLVTVLGRKSAIGGVEPVEIFGGDRAAFEESQRQAASGLFYSGICMLIAAPAILLGGLYLAVFRRR